MKPTEPDTTNQFSQEYIDYILSDDAKALQEVWRRDGVSEGDDCVGTNGDTSGLRGIVHRHRLKMTDGGMATGFAVSENLDGILHWYCNKDKHIPEDWAWLPSLHDLLRIIEGAGWQWSRSPAHWEAWRPASAAIGDAVKEWAIIEDTEDMLAAARLAVRAIKSNA